MGLFLSNKKSQQPKREYSSPNVIVLGSGNRQSGFTAGDLPKIVASGIRIDSKTIRYLRYIAIADEDIYGSVRDLQVLANPGFEINITARSNLQKKRALAALGEINNIFDSRSMDTFINNQIYEVATSGASSVEWVPNRNRTGLTLAAVVPAETVTIERDKENGQLIYKQEIGGKEITLSEQTYLYLPLQTVGDSPYGVPLIIAALRALTRKGNMMDSVDRLLKLLGLAGIVHANVPVPEPERAGFEGESDPAYIDFVSKKLTQVAELLTQGEEEGVFVTPQGTDLNVVSAARDISGAYTAWTDNQHLLWSGARTLPFMRGRSESLSETWAKVAYPIILAEAENIQKVIKRQVEFGLNLHLRLSGIPAKAEVKFLEPASPFSESNARAKLSDAQADSVLVELLGEQYRQKVAAKHGIDLSEGGS